MEEKQKAALLATLKRALDTHPQAWDNYRTLGSVVLDCAEFIEEKTSALRLSKGFVSSCRQIEEILRKEKQPELLADFSQMADVLDQARQLWIGAPKEISDVILITSEFLLIMEEAENS